MKKKVIVIPGPNVFGKKDIYFVSNGFYILGSVVNTVFQRKK